MVYANLWGTGSAQVAYSFAGSTYMESENLGHVPSSNTEHSGVPGRLADSSGLLWDKASVRYKDSVK